MPGSPCREENISTKENLFPPGLSFAFQTNLSSIKRIIRITPNSAEKLQDERIGSQILQLGLRTRSRKMKEGLIIYDLVEY